MKVAVVVGVAVPHDAISSAALEQVAALQSLPEVDEVVLFTQWLDREPGCTSHDTGNPWELVHLPAFRDCDVAIFHWGIHFALFDAITLLGSAGLPKPVVHFHNCTPPSLVDEDRAGQPAALDPPAAPRHRHRRAVLDLQRVQPADVDRLGSRGVPAGLGDVPDRHAAGRAAHADPRTVSTC